jgi:hypothetical protein
VFHQRNHATGEANGSIMVGMFVCCVFCQQKASPAGVFVPAGTDLAVKLLRSIVKHAKTSNNDSHF